MSMGGGSVNESLLALPGQITGLLATQALILRPHADKAGIRTIACRRFRQNDYGLGHQALEDAHKQSVCRFSNFNPENALP